MSGVSEHMSQCIRMAQIYIVFWNGYYVWFW